MYNSGLYDEYWPKHIPHRGIKIKVSGSHLDLMSQKLLIPGNLNFNTFSGKTKAHL